MKASGAFFFFSIYLDILPFFATWDDHLRLMDNTIQKKIDLDFTNYILPLPKHRCMRRPTLLNIKQEGCDNLAIWNERCICDFENSEKGAMNRSFNIYEKIVFLKCSDESNKTIVQYRPVTTLIVEDCGCGSCVLEVSVKMD